MSEKFTVKFERNEWRIYDGNMFYARAPTQEEANERAARLNIVSEITDKIEQEMDDILRPLVDGLDIPTCNKLIRELLDFSGDGRNFTLNMEPWIE